MNHDELKSILQLLKVQMRNVLANKYILESIL